jgi:hypothetical protein
MATAHGNIALYRCWNDGPPQPMQPDYVEHGRRYRRASVAWVGTPEKMASWNRYKPGTVIAQDDGELRVKGTGAGIFGDVTVRPGTIYLIETQVDGARPGDWLSVHSVTSTGTLRNSQWTPLKTPTWFPGGTVVKPAEATLRMYLYSESATDFGVKSVTLVALEDDTVPAAR